MEEEEHANHLLLPHLQELVQEVAGVGLVELAEEAGRFEKEAHSLQAFGVSVFVLDGDDSSLGFSLGLFRFFGLSGFLGWLGLLVLDIHVKEWQWTDRINELLIQHIEGQ